MQGFGGKFSRTFLYFKGSIRQKGIRPLSIGRSCDVRDIFLKNISKFDEVWQILHHVLTHFTGPTPWSSTIGFPSVQNWGLLLLEFGQFTFWIPSQFRCGLYSSVSTRKYPCFWRPSVSLYLSIRVFEIPIKIFYIFGITFEDCEWSMWRSQILEKYPWSKWLCHIFLLLLLT